jgi:hypothetical protein
VQYLLKGRAGGRAKFDEKKLPALPRKKCIALAAIYNY